MKSYLISIVVYLFLSDIELRRDIQLLPQYSINQNIGNHI
jgi:hypothetical protein